MTTGGGGGGVHNPTSIIGGGGQPSEAQLVRIDSDVRPVWETEALPDWVNTWLIPMLSAGQKWPEASESGMSKLAYAYQGLGEAATGSTADAGEAARTVVTGWSAPPTAAFVSRAKVLYGHEGGLAGVSSNAHAYAQQSHNFAVETQYSKLSINVAFWVTVVAIAIALVAAFFSAGSSTALIGPYAAAARAAISRILVRLATVGGRSLTAARLARVTALSGATGPGLITRLLASSLGKELVEEIGEEFFIDAVAQYQQIKMGTRQEWDWKKSQAAIIGAGTGAVIGTRLAGPVSRVTSTVPGFAGRALTTGATNMIASPAGSFIANGAVYGQWENPFSADSLMGAFLGGAGRTGTISPFNPDVYTALANPVSTLASAYDNAARADAARLGDPPPPSGPAGNPSNGSSPDGGPAGTQARTPEPAAARTGAAPSAGGSTRSTAPAATPDTDSTTRRTTAAAPAPDEVETPDRARRATTPRQDTDPDQSERPSQDDPATTDRTRTTQQPAPAGTAETRANGQPTPETTAEVRADEQPPARNTAEVRADEQPSTRDTAQPATTAQDTAQSTTQDTADARTTAAEPAAQDTTAQPAAAEPAAQDTAARPAAQDTTATSPATHPAVPNAASAATPGTSGDVVVSEAPATAPTSPVAAVPVAAGATQDQGTSPTGVVTYESKPGTTVTSRPIEGTRYVADGRQGPDLTLAEVRAATDELLAEYVLDGTVTGFTWSADGSTLIVHTTTDGDQYFRPIIGGLSDSNLMAETTVRQEQDEKHPHKVRFNPRVADDQLARVWLHEITDTLQELRSEGRKGGFLRRRTGETSDQCVEAFRNELAMLHDKWRQAPTMPEKRLLALDIDGTARRLRERGHPPPLPPWAPTQAARLAQAPPPLGPQPSESEVRALVETLTRAEQAIRRQIASKRSSAEEARKALRQANKEARKALKQHDSGRFERARQQRQERRKNRAIEARHLRIADAYGSALLAVVEARRAYEQVLTAMQQAGRPVQPGEVPMADTARILARRADQVYRSYVDTLAKALPRPETLSTAMPTNGLAHLTTLTNRVNDLLEARGAVHRFTPDALERAVRADFHKVVSDDGLVLRVGRGSTAAELRIKLTLSDLAEVLDSAVKASEMMVGLFFQASRTVNATETRSGGLSVGINTAALAKIWSEDDWKRIVAEIVGAGVGVSTGRSQSTTGGAGMFAQGGSVADNRSESLLFDAAASWTVEIRTSHEEGWQDTTVIDSGEPGDPASQRLWISHSYTDQAPRTLEWIPDDQRESKIGNLVLADMSGMDVAFDRIATMLGGDYAKVGEIPREQLHTFLTDELPHRLRDAVNTGIERVFMVDGKPHARVRAKTEIVLVRSELLGGPTSEEWEEEVLVDFVASPGGATTSGSLEGNASIGLKHPYLEGVNGPWDYSPTIGPQLKGSRSASRSYSATANQQAIHPAVHRNTSPKQAYRLALETSFEVERIGETARAVGPIFHHAVVSMRESAAYRYGLPVDSRALIRENGQPVLDRNGRQVLRGEPRPGPAPGRKAELPSYMGDGQGKMRGAGPAMVDRVTKLGRFRRDVLRELAKQGLIPKMVNGEPKYASNELERAAQVLNLQEVMEQLSEHRIRSAYDTLAQDGIVLDLVRHRLNRAPEHFTLHLSLKQEFKAQNVDHTDTRPAVNLGIGSDTSGRAISRSRTYGGSGSVGMGDGPNQGQNGLLHEVGASAGGNRTRTVGSSAGSTTNKVWLNEGGLAMSADVRHVLTAELIRGDETVWTVSRKGKARLTFAADMVEPVTPFPHARLGDIPKKLRSRMKLLHLDVPGVLDAARNVVPEAMRAGSPAHHKIRAMLSVRNLVSHSQMLSQPLTTDLAVDPRGMPTRSSLAVSGSIHGAEVLGIVDQVNGYILFGLGSAGVNWGGSSGITTGGSGKGGDVGNGGQLTESGSLGGPSRTGGTSNSTSVLDIWGTEELTIEFGRQYVVRADLDLTLTGSDHATNLLPGDQLPAEERSETAKGSALLTVPEHDMLLLYAQGEIDLPGALVGDAVERLINGGLKLDATVAFPLVQRYVMNVARAKAAGEDVSYAQRHTPEALLPKLDELLDLPAPPAGTPAHTAEEQLSHTLSKANEVLQRSRDVVLAPMYDRQIGVGASESLTLTDDQNNEVGIFDAVVNAVEDFVPGALDGSPTLREELAVDFSEDAALIHINDMWSPVGFKRSYHVQAGNDVSQAEEVTVKARLVYDNDSDALKATLLSRTSEAGIIVQHYRYLDRSHSESYNGSWGIGLEGSTAENGDGENMGVSTDRGRSYSSSINQQSTRLQRQGRFSGLDRVQQDMKLVIEVTRRPVRAGKLHRGPRTSDPVTYKASHVRRIPTGMTRPAGTVDPEPELVTDPRQAELRPGHFPDGIRLDTSRPLLINAIMNQLSKMLGANAAEERRSELEKRMEPSALLTAFERMAAPEGHVERAASLRFKHQGVRFEIKARTSDLTILAGPFEGEKGQVDRATDAQNVTVSRSRVLPAGVSVGGNENFTGLNGGARAGEQASESFTDHHGARRERSGFEKGPLYTVRFRVDYDLTFEHVTRLRKQDEKAVGDPVHLPAAAGGTVDVTLTQEELEELLSRMESNVRIGPPPPPPLGTFQFIPADGRQGLIQALRDARVAARERHMTARVAVRDGNRVHRYLVDPYGTVRSEMPDGEFAEAFSSLPPPVLDAAERANLPLRRIFFESQIPGTFTQQVKAELAKGGVFVDVAKPAWPVVQTPSGPTKGGSTAQGWAAGGAPSPALEGTLFDRAGRPDGTPDLTLDELHGQDLPALDLGAAHVSWTAGDRMAVQFPAAPDQHVRFVIEDPGPGLNGVTETRAGTPEDPHVVRLWPRVHPDVVSSVLVHELSHVAQAGTAAEAGAPQGVIRTSLTGRPAEGDDLCLLPRLDEHAHLSRKWHAAPDSHARGRLADAIDAIAADLERRGHTPPPPPWGTGSRTEAPEGNRIARLLSGGPAADPALAAAHRLPLPEAAAAAAVQRAAVAMGARVHVRGPGRMDLIVPGRASVPVEVRSVQDQGRVPEQRRGEQGPLVIQVDGRLTVGANERAAAAQTAQVIARARGLEAADLAALAELYEAVRQARAASTVQRPGRLGVLYDLVTAARPEVLRMVPGPVAAELDMLARGERPRDWPAHLQRLRTLANTTGWLPLNECSCPDGEPCTCGLRPAGEAAPVCRCPQGTPCVCGLRPAGEAAGECRCPQDAPCVCGLRPAGEAAGECRCPQDAPCVCGLRRAGEAVRV